MDNYVIYGQISASLPSDHSVVYKGRKRGTLSFVAIHRYDKFLRPEVTNAVRLTHSLNSKNVVRFYEWYETTNHIWVVYELSSGGTLTDVIRQDGCMPESAVQTLGINLASGLFYIHSSGMVYGDLCPDKVLLGSTPLLKYSDFGLAQRDGEDLQDVLDGFAETEDFDDSLESTTGYTDVSSLGNTLYKAPELLLGESPTQASDLWSFGCVLYELYTGHPPYKAQSFADQREKILNGGYPSLKRKDGKAPSADLLDLLAKLMCKNADDRMKWPDLVSHPFWNELLAVAVGDQISLLPTDGAVTVGSLATSSWDSSTGTSSSVRRVQREPGAGEGDAEATTSAAEATHASASMAEMPSDPRQERSDNMNDPRLSKSDADADSRQSRSDAVADPRQSRSDVVADPRQSRSDVVADPRQSRSDPVADPRQSRSDVVTNTRQSRSDVVADPRQSRSNAVTDTRQSRSDAVAEPRQSRSDAVADPRQSRSNVVADPRQSRSDVVADPRQSRSDVVTDTRQSRSDAVTDTRKSRSDVVADPRQSRSDVVTDTRQSRSDAVTDTRKSRSDEVADLRRSRSEELADSKQMRADELPDPKQATSEECFNLSPRSAPHKNDPLQMSISLSSRPFNSTTSLSGLGFPEKVLKAAERKAEMGRTVVVRRSADHTEEVTPVKKCVAWKAAKIAYHISDLTRTPIIDNPKVFKRKITTKWDAKTLPLQVYSLEEVAVLEPADLTDYLSQLLQHLSQPVAAKASALRSRVQLLSYTGHLCQCPSIADALLSLCALELLVPDVKRQPHVDLKCLVAWLVGVICYHAQHVEQQYVLIETVTLLSEITRDCNRVERVGPRLVAALGEMLALVARQEEAGKADEEEEEEGEEGEGEEEANTNNGRSGLNNKPPWNLPVMTFTVFIKGLQNKENATLSHAAVKTIENVSVTGGATCRKFATNEVAKLLWNVHLNSTVENQRYSAVLALCRLCRLVPQLFQSIIENVGIREALQALDDAGPKSRQLLVTMFVCVLKTRHAQASRFLQSGEMLGQFVKQLDSATVMLRAKAYLAICAAVDMHRPLLAKVCESRLLAHVERDWRLCCVVDTGDHHLDYLQRCLDVLACSLGSYVPLILDDILATLMLCKLKQPYPSSVHSELEQDEMKPHSSSLHSELVPISKRDEAIFKRLILGTGSMRKHRTVT
ncbi:PREDICTED: serine/threonine-protein kinase ULK4-like isoform X2 [Priapulus caudatus]|uniref:Serine/threonine-protein kinase ULK4-like isoform X2 n=1 Tax=Priapulus caudatus TaxID=37621 RepID=A0ABM1E1M3_PRICU|nr:PREDICTED: serine/threonine-protein kinase ULK4-like isoform X2 [Priapulus caudatus]